jgi:outer membrane protein assembly factor BamE (lipoprotein component of BamABCDE complex)
MFHTSRVRFAQALSVGVCALLLAGCGGVGNGNPKSATRVKDNFDKVKEGMTVDEVVALLGPAEEGAAMDAGAMMKDMIPKEMMKDLPGINLDMMKQEVKGWKEGETVYAVVFLGGKMKAKSSGPKDKGKAGDGSKVTKENFEKIKVGMSRKEVEAILGLGKAKAGAKVEGLSGEIVVWEDDKKVIQIGFVDDKVTGMVQAGL